MRRFTWTKMRKNLRTMLTDPKEPMTPAALKAWMRELRQKAAKEQGWGNAELALTIAEDNREIDEVARRVGVTT